MTNFSLGVVLGTAMGVGIIIALNPMDKRARRKVCRKASRVMRRINDSIHEMA